MTDNNLMNAMYRVWLFLLRAFYQLF